MDDELEEWVQENFRKPFAGENPKQYHIERQLFMLIWYDCMQMEMGLSGRYPSEACDISYIAWTSAYSYSWLI